MSEDREGWANPTAEAGGLRPRISITTAEVADLLGVSRQRVLQLVRDHPAFPDPIRRERGKRAMLLYPRPAVLDFLAAWSEARKRHRPPTAARRRSGAIS